MSEIYHQSFRCDILQQGDKDPPANSFGGGWVRKIFMFKGDQADSWYLCSNWRVFLVYKAMQKAKINLNHSCLQYSSNEQFFGSVFSFRQPKVGWKTIWKVGEVLERTENWINFITFLPCLKPTIESCSLALSLSDDPWIFIINNAVDIGSAGVGP